VTEDELRAIEERWERATPGPWAWDSRGDKENDVQIGVVVDHNGVQVGGFVEEDDDCIYTDGVAFIDGGNEHGNAEAIASARTDVPALVAEVRRLREVLENIRSNIIAAQNRPCELNDIEDYEAWTTLYGYDRRELLRIVDAALAGTAQEANDAE